MLQDTITLIEGADIVNATIASGTSDPSNPSTGELFYRTDTLKLRVYNGSAWADVATGGGGSGTVTSVALSSSDLSVSGSPVTTSGTITANLQTVNSNVGSFGDASHVGAFTVNGKGLITAASSIAIAIASGAVSGLATSATTDTTNASNISSGTLASGRLTGTYTGVTGLGTQTTALNMGSHQINSVSTPTSSTDAANKSYVDAIAAGLTWKNAVKASTTANLSGTYSGTPNFTLTNNGTQVALTLDGISLSVSDRVLVKNQTTQSQNGIYTVTTVGTGSSNWVLTRATDFDSITPIDEINGAAVYVEQGTLNSNTGWTQIDVVTTFDTSNIAWAQFSGAGSGVSSLTGTTNRLTASSATGAVTIDISSSYVGQTSITTLGTIGTGTWSASTIAATVGGTGQTTYTVGDILYASASNALSKLAASTSGFVLTSNGAGVAPSWQASTGGVSSITGTASQITASASTGAVTLSLPATINVNTSGSAATLTTPRAINGVNFDGSAAITVTAAAGTLTGTTLNSTVVSSSLTSIGTITTGTWSATTIAATKGGTGQVTYTIGDILYADSSSTLTRLAASTSGLVLTTNGAGTAPSWNAVTASGISPLTTKGDIWGYTTVNARIPVGSDGQVLTADSTQTTGVAWSAAASSGTSMGLVSAVQMGLTAVIF